MVYEKGCVANVSREFYKELAEKCVIVEVGLSLPSGHELAIVGTPAEVAVAAKDYQTRNKKVVKPKTKKK